MSNPPDSTSPAARLRHGAGRLRHPAGALPPRRPGSRGAAASPVAPVLPRDGAADRSVGPRLHADRARLARATASPSRCNGRDSPRQAPAWRTSPAATLEFVDALGIGRFGIYGFHTGASIGTALAQARPDRVAAVAANGLVVLTEAERAAILRDYLPPLVPRWDGGHLAWLWARMREQAIFFPWHDRRAATRMDFDVPPADRLHAGLLEFLAAGDHYHVAYAAAFMDRAERRLPALRGAAAGHRRGAGPAGGSSGPDRTPARQRAAWSTAADTAAALDQRVRAPRRAIPAMPRRRRAATAAPTGSASPVSAYLGAPGRQIRVLRQSCAPAGHPPAGCPTVILLHAPGSSAGRSAPWPTTSPGTPWCLPRICPGTAPAMRRRRRLNRVPRWTASSRNWPGPWRPTWPQPGQPWWWWPSAPARRWPSNSPGRLGADDRRRAPAPPAWSAADTEEWLTRRPARPGARLVRRPPARGLAHGPGWPPVLALVPTGPRRHPAGGTRSGRPAHPPGCRRPAACERDVASPAPRRAAPTCAPARDG